MPRALSRTQKAALATAPDPVAIPPKVADALAGERADAIDSIGASAAPSANRRGGNGARLLPHEAEELYAKSSTAARIVDVVAEEATRAGFVIQTDEPFDQNEFKSWWEGLDADAILTQAIKYARIYGGSGVLMISRTEGDEEQIWRDGEEIDSLRPVACIEMQPKNDQQFDPNELGMPEVWNVSPLYGGTDVPVHNSRILKMQGRAQPVSWRKNGTGSQRYFGMSVYQGGVEEILDYDDCHLWASLLLKRLQQGVWYGDGIADACETKSGEKSVHRRLALVDGIRSARSTIAVDKENEDYKLLNGSLSGVKDLLGEKKARLTQTYGIPAIVLTGDTSGGLNASAEGALSTWEDTISRLQTFQLTPIVQRIVQTKYPNLVNYKVVWNDLTQETAKDRGDRLQKESAADTAYVEKYVLTVDEVRKTLEKRGDYVLGVKPPEPPQIVTPEDADPTLTNNPNDNGAQ